MKSDIILNLCPTGMVADKRSTPHVPLSPAEVIADVNECVSLGANLVHVHARDQDGRPSYCRRIYAEIICGIRTQHPNLTICVSLSGRHHTEYEKRSDPLQLGGDLRPDMGSLTLASMNFSDQASINSPETVRRLADTMLEKGIKPELEIFDLGMVNYAKYLISKGALQPPYYFNILLGNIAGAQVTLAHLAALTSELPEGSTWCVAGLGREQLRANMLGLVFGDGVRVGIEDNNWLDGQRNRLATNADLVRRIASAAGLLQRRIATVDGVRARLGIKPLCG